MVEIKRLGEERWREVMELRQEALVRNPTAFCSAYRGEASMPEGEWRKRTGDTIFAVEGGRPVGMIALRSSGGQKAGETAALYGVYVRKESRGQGIGRMLVEAAVKAISEDPRIRKIELAVNTTEIGTIRTYERCGFVRVGVKGDGAGGKDCGEVLMEMRLVRPPERGR